jgi:hypothetical protein
MAELSTTAIDAAKALADAGMLTTVTGVCEPSASDINAAASIIDEVFDKERELTRELSAEKRLLHVREARQASTERIIALRDALKLLVADVQDYEAWQRPCRALDVARETLTAEEQRRMPTEAELVRDSW